MAEMTNDGFQVLTLGAVKADGTPDMANILFSFPCPHNAMTISQAVKIDEVSVPGRSGKVKQATGYDDTNITVSIRLDDREERAAPGEDGPYVITISAGEQLAELQAAFRDRSSSSSNGAVPSQVPTVFSIISRLTNLCGIKTVLFKSMDVTEFEGETHIQVTMSFTEFEPAPRVAERKGRGKKKISEADQYMEDMAYYDELEAADAFVGPESSLIYTGPLSRDEEQSNRFQHDLALLGDAAGAKLQEIRQKLKEDSPMDAAMARIILEKAVAQYKYDQSEKAKQDELAKTRAMESYAVVRSRY